MFAAGVVARRDGDAADSIAGGQENVVAGGAALGALILNAGVLMVSSGE